MSPACEAFSDEMKTDFVRLWHWLEGFKINPAGFSVKMEDGGSYKPCFDKRFHASGHASREDIRGAIDQADPDYIVPIRIEARNWFNENFQNTMLVDEGLLYKFG